MHNNSGVNKVFLIGQITTDPRRHKNFNCADKLCFTMVTKESFHKGDQLTDHEEHHHVVVHDDHPDVKNISLKAGNLLHVIGKIQTKNWFDEQNIKRYKTEIMVLQLQVL